MKWSLLRIVWGVALITGTSPSASAQTAYSVNDGNATLYSIDLATGNINAIGATGVDDIEALAFDPTGQTLYAIEDDDETLLTCSIVTGACSAVGSLGLGGNAVSSAGLAFTCDGRLFMVDSNESDDLWEVDPQTGAATTIGALPVGISSLASRAGDGICPSGLFGVNAEPADALYCIDVNTGNATLLGALSTSFDDESAIEFAPDGTLWIIEDGVDDSLNIARINPANGQVTDAGYDLPPSTFESLAMPSLPNLCSNSTPAPAASPMGLILTVLAITGIGYFALRRSVRAA